MENEPEIQETSIQLRLTKRQKEIAMTNMELHGYKTMSSFIRDMLIGFHPSSQEMIIAIHKKVCK